MLVRLQRQWPACHLVPMASVCCTESVILAVTVEKFTGTVAGHLMYLVEHYSAAEPVMMVAVYSWTITVLN